ncbi:hypothetical protein GOODEAATRI_003878 [Goodea atripinnis]|uniref:Uncharacterized protein n=1 Tax=Goodea atripinnis TaxID=208336 RepID=A0ABV0N7X3_9TELE
MVGFEGHKPSMETTEQEVFSHLCPLLPVIMALFKQMFEMAFRCNVILRSCFVFFPLSTRFQTVINTMCGFGVQTQKYLDANKSIYPVGCADRAVMWIESHLLLVGALTLGLALPQVTPHTHVLNSCYA